jgi:hypothetical protein
MCVFPSISQSANYDRLTAQVLLRIYLFSSNPRRLPSGTSMQDISCMFPISWSHCNMQSGRRVSEIRFLCQPTLLCDFVHLS